MAEPSSSQPAPQPPVHSVRGRVVTPAGVLEDGVVAVAGASIAWVGPAADAPPWALDAVARSSGAPAHATGPVTVLPGLVDVHCHGGGGASFPDATDLETARTAVAEHLRHGTTSLVASLVTAAEETLLVRTALLADLADAGEIAGIHLEGPYLSPALRGAQDPHHMTVGDASAVRRLADAARGHLVTMTVAPDVPGVLGADGVAAALAAVGALPSFGHTGADAELTTTAIAEAREALAGPAARSARPTVTHLFNGMPPMHHRSPGPIAASLAAAARGDAVVELVADGVHLAPATVRMVFDLLGPGAVVLVTDAMAAAGMPDGAYVLGDLDVVVRDGVARLTEGGAIAGGTAHALDLVRHTVAAGVPLTDAVAAASVTPAAVLGRTDIGALEAGRRADLVLVDADLRPLAVMRAGSWVGERPRAVVPAPVRLRPLAGAPFPLRDARVLAEPAAESAVAHLVERADALVGATITRSAEHGPGAIVLVLDAAALGSGAPATDAAAEAAAAQAPGGYVLDVRTEQVTITAGDVAGLHHGVATLLQLAGTADGLVRPVRVVDAPRFPWRGLSLDVARHVQTVDTVRTLLDVMADLRLGVLHLHLTDDQGWRLELASRPELTARSGGTAVDGDPGGFFTAADYAAIQAHAARRGIVVVPEIDLPGHVNAALHALPELNPDGVAPAAYEGIEVGFSQLRADLPATEPFIRAVLTEVAALTVGPYVHIGGDEPPEMPSAEYATLVGLAADAVRAAGKTVIGWQETARAELPAGSVVQYWDERSGADEVAAATRAGVRVLLSPARRTYLDQKYDADTPVGLEWASHIEVRDAYDWEPLDVLPDVAAADVVGVEAGVWSETIRGQEDLFFLLLPRLAAFAEVAWSAPDVRDWDDFAARVRLLAPRWDDAGLRWYRSPQVAW